MIKYKKPISVSKKFQYGGTVTIGADYAPDRLERLSRAWEGFKDWNRASAASTGRAVSKAIPKVTPIARTVSKVAGPIGIASMILTPAQANVGEDELFRNPSSPYYRGRFLTESSDGQASEEQANESAATKEGAAAGTVSNPQEDPNKKKDEKKDKKKNPQVSMRTLQKIFWETPKHNFKWLNDNTYTSPGFRNLVRVFPYGFAISTVNGVVPALKGLGQWSYNNFINSPGPTTQLDSLQQEIDKLNMQQQILEKQNQLDSIKQANQPIQFNYSDTTQNRQMLDSIQKLEEKRSLYGLGHQNRQ